MTTAQNTFLLIHPLRGTIFHKSSTPLKLWFYAIYLVSQSKNGVSAKELERHLGCTYKCAWRMAKQIRSLMASDNKIKLTGVVEVDETYIGGKTKKGVRGRGSERKTAVLGVVQRNGSARVKAIEDVSRWIIMNYVRENVETGTNLMADEYNAYSYAKRE